MTIRIHVYVYRAMDRWQLDYLFKRGGHPGIQWDQCSLIFSGTTLEEIDCIATQFYREIMKLGLRRTGAQMRHRMGRNGHGWPSTPIPLWELIRPMMPDRVKFWEDIVAHIQEK